MTDPIDPALLRELAREHLDDRGVPLPHAYPAGRVVLTADDEGLVVIPFDQWESLCQAIDLADGFRDGKYDLGDFLAAGERTYGSRDLVSYRIQELLDSDVDTIVSLIRETTSTAKRT